MIGDAIERAKLWLWRRDQLTNANLREWFRTRYGIDVGLYSYGCFDRWRMPGPLVIGRYCSIASSVRSAPGNHLFDAITTHPALYASDLGVVDDDVYYPDPQVIEDDVWIGHNAIILPSCRRIGRGSIIGAGSIVTRDVPKYVVMAGNPARALRARFPPDVQAALEQSRWWDMDLAGLRKWVLTDRKAVFQPTAKNILALAETLQH